MENPEQVSIMKQYWSSKYSWVYIRDLQSYTKKMELVTGNYCTFSFGFNSNKLLQTNGAVLIAVLSSVIESGKYNSTHGAL